ncbi:hypothetical protein HK104_006288 [Borealophlyctis nickersoniae]|nr:hypothetical protein HK104_006288 [Borealophlyctis nickersoniae]
MQSHHPGIQFVPARPPSSSSSALLGSTPANAAVHLRYEIARLRRSVEMLLRSNVELREFCKEGEHDGDEEVFAQAIEENVHVINRRIRQIRELEIELESLGGTGTCGGDVGTPTSPGPSSLRTSLLEAQGTVTQIPQSGEIEEERREGNDGEQQQRAVEDDGSGGLYI